MFERLSPYFYSRLAPLVAPLGTQHLIVQALLDGSSPGTVYVDDIAHPHSAFITSAEGRFLLGTPTNAPFNIALRHHLERLFAGEREAWEEELVLTCYPDTWADVLQTTILPFRPPFVSQRRYYQHHISKMDDYGISIYPDDSTLSFIDADMLARTDLVNHESILFWINKNYGNADTFLAQGLGICFVQDQTIVSWSLTDCAWGEYCEIGIETDENYRRQGLATVLTSAMVDHCHMRKWKYIGWHCWESNLGSIGVAEVVGFHHHATYNAYVSLYDSLMHLAVQGYTALGKSDFATAAHWYGQVSEMENAPHWAFYQLARCHAMLHNPEAALVSLRRAVEKGWDDGEHLRNNPHFAPLHGYQAWNEILALLDG